ncbi:flagellar hook-length control protein FliK [Ureibacillus sp. MALMAid1270]|uniref:flagellar hook-length control protein FliK n=1 Tax=Ureibacillus sp. MALMAid1270 TaxID=3411629 RepID=UPI003BA71DCE
MNLGIMQLSKVNLNQVSQSKPKNYSVNTSSTAVNSGENNFGTVFKKIINSQSNQTEEVNSAVRYGEDTSEITELLEAESIEEVLDLLGISHDEGLFMIEFSSDQSAKSLDELMNLEDLLSLIEMDQEQLQRMLGQLLNDEQPIKDIWQLIQFINEQAPNFVDQITTALQGEQSVSPKEAKQFVQLLKLAQIVGEKSDLFNEQPIQLGSLKEVLKEISQNLGQLSKTTESSTSGKISLQGFQQITKHIESQDQQSMIATTSSGVTQKTISISLPVEKSAQGEALVKEIQQLMNRSQLSNSQGTMKLLLKLYPENLGSIRIEIMQKDGVLSARLLASTPHAKELLEGQINQLKTSFTQANIQMDRIDIAQSLQDPDRNLRDQNLFSNFFKQQQQDKENDYDDNPEEDEERMSFQDYLINEEV